MKNVYFSKVFPVPGLSAFQLPSSKSRHLPVLLVLLLGFAWQSKLFAQGPQIRVTVPVNARSWSGPLPSQYEGFIYLPEQYSQSTARYPVLFYFHGTGVMQTNDLLGQGLPQLLAGGMRPDNIVNKVDGKSYSFIVVSLRDANPYIIPATLRWLQSNYRIDSNRVYTTGLSMGGANTWFSTVTADSISRHISAAVSMSMPGVNAAMDLTLLTKYKIHTWFLSGNSDGFTNTGAVAFHAKANAQFPNSSFLTLFNGGHCCWNTYYHTNYKDTQLGMNIYQWMLQYAKTPVAPPPPPPPPSPPMRIKSATLKRG